MGHGSLSFLWLLLINLQVYIFMGNLRILHELVVLGAWQVLCTTLWAITQYLLLPRSSWSMLGVGGGRGAS